MKYGFSGKSLAILCEKMGMEYIGLPEVGIPGGVDQDSRPLMCPVP